MPLRDYEKQISAGVRRNFWIILGVHAFWGFGSAFNSHFALIPVFLQELGASNLVIGALPALVTLCMFGPQLLAAQLTAPLPVKKYVFTVIHYPAALSAILLGLLTCWWGTSRPGALIAATLISLSAFGLALSFTMPIWSNLAAKLLPQATRGRHFGMIFLAGGITGGAASLLSQWFNRALPFPQGFGIGFILGGVIMAGAGSAFFFLEEPAHPDPAPKRGIREFLLHLRQDLSGQRDFQFYLLSQILSGVARMAPSFFAVAARAKHGFGVEVGATFTAITLLARVVGCPLAGWAGDRFGFRFLAFFPPLLTLLSCLLAIGVDYPGTYYFIFALGGLAGAAETVAMINLPIEFCPHADKTSFVAARSTIASPVMALSPLLGGFLVDRFGGRYVVPFAGAVVFEALSLLVLFVFVREPRKREVASSGPAVPKS